MWFKKTFSIFSLLFLIFNVQASILDSEVFKLLEELSKLLQGKQVH